MAHLDKNHPQLSHLRQCFLLSLSRSSTYYTPKDSTPKTIFLMNEIRDIWERYPFYGYRRIQAQLERQGETINRKRVRRLMKIMRIRAIYPGPKTSEPGTENRKYPYLLNDLALTLPNQVWATDITYIKLASGFVYLVAIIDVYSRYIISWRLSNSLSVSFCLETLNEALEVEIPEIFNTDQGSQFTCDEWVYTLVNWGVKPSMTGVGRCLDNIHMERFWRTLKYENTYIYGYSSMADARLRIAEFIDFYNHQRPHQSLCYQTPGEVYSGLCLEKWPDGYGDNSHNRAIEFPPYPQAQQQQELISLM